MTKQLTPEQQRLKKLRKRLGLSVEDFGKRLELTERTIEAYEQGYRNPTKQTMKLATVVF